MDCVLLSYRQTATGIFLRTLGLPLFTGKIRIYQVLAIKTKKWFYYAMFVSKGFNEIGVQRYGG